MLFVRSIQAKNHRNKISSQALSLTIPWFIRSLRSSFWILIVLCRFVSPRFSDRKLLICDKPFLKGTARTPKYTVLYDDYNFKMEQLENITYHLCYGHQIVFMPTSLPSPVYIALRYAERGRMLYQQWRFDCLSLVDCTEGLIDFFKPLPCFSKFSISASTKKSNSTRSMISPTRSVTTKPICSADVWTLEGWKNYKRRFSFVEISASFDNPLTSKL